MSKERRRDRIKNLFQNPYRIVIFNDHNLHIIKQIRFNAKTFLLALVFIVFCIIVGVTMLIAFTPLREYIPGYPTGAMRQMLIKNVLVVDSLETEIQKRDRYFNDFRGMLSGNISKSDTSVKRGTILRPDQVQFKKIDHDSIFKNELSHEKNNLGIKSSANRGGISSLLFFPPINGLVTSKYNAIEGHFGVDVVGSLNSKVSATLDGTVVFAGWTIESGYVIYVQHEQNLITVYRHNSELLKVLGDRVKAGEAIAIMGNSGKETSGPHLHFEMWLNGVSINPEDYIKF